MPLKFLIAGDPAFAFDFSSEKWKALKVESRVRKHLSMPCCKAKATPKTSKLANHFVAHTRTDNCNASTETAEHLLAKTIVAKAVRLAGWEVDIEVSGSSPEGESWVADVLATKDQVTVAIEVQWSRQDQDETKRRQERYTQSGVRGLWLLRYPDLLIERETPTFRLRYDEVLRQFTVMIPSPYFYPGRARGCNKNEPRDWQQEIDLTEFVVGALNKKLRFAPSVGQQVPLMVSTAKITCWRCKQKTRIVLSLMFNVEKVLPRHPNINAKLYDFEGFNDGGAFLATIFPKNVLLQHKIGPIKHRYSKTTHSRYLSNGCFHCDALQGRFFEHEYGYDAAPTYTVVVNFENRLIDYLKLEEDIFRWWFDQSDVFGHLATYAIPPVSSTVGITDSHGG